MADFNIKNGGKVYYPVAANEVLEAVDGRIILDN